VSAGSAKEGARWLALLWDLDGTLIDTGRDLATAVNGLLTEYGLEPLTNERVAGHVGKGARNLVTRCLEDRGRTDLDDESISAALRVFEKHYDQHLLDTTRPFPGLLPILATLSGRGERMGVVTNKPAGFSRQLLRALELEPHFGALVGGDSTSRRKPDPEPLLAALRQLGLAGNPPEGPAREILMIGDTSIDIETARAAGVRSLAVSWGFASRANLEAAGPDRIVDDARELAAALDGGW